MPPWSSWEHAWQQALYGPHGFYRRPEGPGGHFATSAQGIPGVGTLLASAVVALARGADVQQLIDVGAGRGELLTEVHRIDPGLSLLGIDVVDRPSGLPAAVAWRTSPGGAALPDRAASDALVLAHEWLDVVPAAVVERDGTATLRVVEVEESGAERLGPPVAGPDLTWCQQHWWPAERGHRAEVGRTRDAAWNALCANATRSLVIAVDYGHTAQERPAYGTLTGFRDGAEVTPRPDGSTDVTAHVSLDTLTADRRVRQADLLRELGLLPTAPDHALATTDPPAYLRALAARSAAQAAIARPGLGDFWWVLRQT